MRRHLWVNAANGVAGDMLLAALIDAGADRLAVIDAWAALEVDGFVATWERVDRAGIAALWTNLVIDHDDVGGQHDHHDHEHPAHRPAGDVIALIEQADLDPAIIDAATAVYRRLAEVEGLIHGIEPMRVELHEVGALDSILDVVGVCAALADLGVDELSYSPIGVGHGTVEAAHGTMPNPVPAVMRLVESADHSEGPCRVVGVDTGMELATPTGVALLTVLGERCGAAPTMSVVGNGFGAGTADPPGRPNVTHVVVGDLDQQTDVDTGGTPTSPQRALVVETNVDDVTGEVLAATIERLLDAGAHDAWATPIVMKKGRPAHTVSALCDRDDLDLVRAMLLAHTGSLGARTFAVDKFVVDRRVDQVEIDGHRIGVKVGGHGRIKVEFDDADAAARALGRPVRDVLVDAEAAARRHFD